MKRPSFSKFPWSLVAVLVVIDLIRPLLSIAGLFDGLRPIGPLVATALIAILRVGIAVFMQIDDPILVLAVAGAGYAVASILMNVIWGACLGLVAQVTISLSGRS